jgi:FMN-dependent NADH-azoreductase
MDIARPAVVDQHRLQPADFATGWLRQVLGFLGIHDVRVIAADRQAVVGPGRLVRAEAALDAAVAEAAAEAAAAPMAA